MNEEKIRNCFTEVEEGVNIDVIYPLGSLYFSMNEVNPGTFLNGIWKRIQNQFLMAASSTYPVGTTGGTIGHHHTLNNAYARIGCAQGVMYYNRKYGTAIPYNQTIDSPKMSHTDRQVNQNLATSLDGRTDNTSLLPPYLAVSILKRVA